MNEQQLDALKKWFMQYTKSFYSSHPAHQKNISLKEAHTYHVCRNIMEIARDLLLVPDMLRLAEIVALFHDVGRFPQYKRYKTFRDSISTNHGALGSAVLIENNVLRNVPADEREIILRAVALHNVFTVPEKLDDQTLFFVKMIRDADKLDIWRVFIEYYAQPDEDRANAAGLGLPDIPDYSPEVLASLLRKEMVHLSSLRTLNDFKLLQLAWIFDLNFTRSLQLVLERGYIEKIASSLPHTGDIARAVGSIRDYVDRKTGAKGTSVLSS